MTAIVKSIMCYLIGVVPSQAGNTVPPATAKVQAENGGVIGANTTVVTPAAPQQSVSTTLYYYQKYSMYRLIIYYYWG